MASKLIFKKNYGEFSYEPSLKCIFHHWKGFLLLEEVKYVAETTHKVMEEYGLVNVIADHRDMELFSEEVSEYIASIWIPMQESIGVRHICVVLSEDAFARMAAEDMHEMAKSFSTITISHYKSMDDAIEAVKKFNLDL